MDFFTTWVSGLKFDMWTIALIFVSVVAVPLLYILYRRFTASTEKQQATMEDSLAPSNDHSQALQEEDQPRETPHDESSSEHLTPSQDTPE